MPGATVGAEHHIDHVILRFLLGLLMEYIGGFRPVRLRGHVLRRGAYPLSRLRAAE